jgi:hypothetical protein
MTDPRSHDLDPQLRDAVDRLPEELPPARDLWPAIRAEMDADRLREFSPAGGTVPLDRTARPAFNLGVRGIAAAAAAVILITATVTWQLRGPAPITDTPPAPPTAPGLVTFASYEAVADELAALLAQRSARLDPATIEVLERTMQTIDEALAEAREALARDPESARARGFVESAWRQKLDFLRRANDVAALRQG